MITCEVYKAVGSWCGHIESIVSARNPGSLERDISHVFCSRDITSQLRGAGCNAIMSRTKPCRIREACKG